MSTLPKSTSAILKEQSCACAWPARNRQAITANGKRRPKVRPARPPCALRRSACAWTGTHHRLLRRIWPRNRPLSLPATKPEWPRRIGFARSLLATGPYSVAAQKDPSCNCGAVVAVARVIPRPAGRAGCAPCRLACPANGYRKVTFSSVRIARCAEQSRLRPFSDEPPALAHVAAVVIVVGIEAAMADLA